MKAAAPALLLAEKHSVPSIHPLSHITLHTSKLSRSSPDNQTVIGQVPPSMFLQQSSSHKAGVSSQHTAVSNECRLSLGSGASGKMSTPARLQAAAVPVGLTDISAERASHLLWCTGTAFHNNSKAVSMLLSPAWCCMLLVHRQLTTKMQHSNRAACSVQSSMLHDAAYHQLTHLIYHCYLIQHMVGVHSAQCCEKYGEVLCGVC